MAPNLVQTLEGTPAFVHGGPFANIAHGCNSVLATTAALKLGDVVVTEAGFGADLGAEKYIDIVARQTGLEPDLSIVVATVRALKFHGGVGLADLEREDVTAVRAGLPNLERHVRMLQEVFGQRVLVAINQFASDSPAEIDEIEMAMRDRGVDVVLSHHFADGGAGATELARAVMEALSHPSRTSYCYDESAPLQKKAEQVVTKVYGGTGVIFAPAARRELSRLEDLGWGHLPVCFAKTQYSFSTDPKVLGAPTDFDVPIREVRLSAGAGFVVLISGTIMTMPGLPKRPSACDIAITPEGVIYGMH